MNLLQALIQTVLPVFFLASLGWVARRVLAIDVKEPARLAVYLLVPALIIHSVLGAQMVASEVSKVIGFCLLLTAAMIAATLLVARLLGWSRSEESAALLTTSFMNAANFGLPIVLLAFGPEGFERGAVFVVPSSLMMYTVAVYFAARGQMDWRQAVGAVFRLPIVWAAGGALAIRWLGIGLPEFVTQPIGMLANAAVVIMVILLGMQVAQIKLRGAGPKLGWVTALRLLLSPLVALALVAWLKPEPLTGKVLVLQAAMPASVNTTLLAVQFGTEPDQVSGATLVTTVLSLATISFWVWFLQP